MLWCHPCTFNFDPQKQFITNYYLSPKVCYWEINNSVTDIVHYLYIAVTFISSDHYKNDSDGHYKHFTLHRLLLTLKLKYLRKALSEKASEMCLVSISFGSRKQNQNQSPNLGQFPLEVGDCVCTQPTDASPTSEQNLACYQACQDSEPHRWHRECCSYLSWLEHKAIVTDLILTWAIHLVAGLKDPCGSLQVRIPCDEIHKHSNTAPWTSRGLSFSSESSDRVENLTFVLKVGHH